MKTLTLCYVSIMLAYNEKTVFVQPRFIICGIEKIIATMRWQIAIWSLSVCIQDLFAPSKESTTRFLPKTLA